MQQEEEMLTEPTPDAEELSCPEEPDSGLTTDCMNALLSETARLSQAVEGLAEKAACSKQLQLVSQQVQELNLLVQSLAQTQAQQAALMESIRSGQESNERRLMQALRENANFQIQVRSGMQHDLDELKRRVSGEQLIPVLKEISEMYVDYIFLTECDLPEAEIKKNLRMMFSQMEDFFEENGADVCVSQTGCPRKSRSCRIASKILTDDPEKHNTVARSRKPGIIKDKTILQPEYVDLYVYEPSDRTAEQKDE